MPYDNYKNVTFHLWDNRPSLPLAISMKLLFSAGHLCFTRGVSLMKLVCSGVHFSVSRTKERGRNQNGMADSRVMTPAMR